MTKRPEDKSATVPLVQTVPLAQQAEEIRSRWRWVEPCAWTVRMLTTLEQGVEGGRWFRLFDKVFAERNLWAAFQQVARKDGAPGIDHVTVREFERQLPDSIWELSDRIKSGRFVPQAIRRVHVPKPGADRTRPLGIPTVRDRVVQAAIVNVIEPIFERDFAEHSYGFRPGRDGKDALRRVDQLLKQGYVHVVDADLQGYFDSIPHERLMSRLEEKISDGSLLALTESFLKASVMEGATAWTPQDGVPQGAVLSPLLSNVYLNPLDHLMAQRGYEMVRYADDFVILCRSPEEAQAALEQVRQWVAENGLTLHPEKTHIVNARDEGFDFLGYHFRGAKHWPRKQSVKKLKATLRAKTKRSSGRSMSCVIADVNRTLRGWFEYFKHGRPYVHGRIDSWLRQRLRAILRKHHKLRGCAKGWETLSKWPNDYFAAQGLFSLATAHSDACQSTRW
jgi:RNA-directed DNA polymerase